MKIKNAVISSLIVLISTTSYGQLQKPFPTLQAQKLNEQQVTIPKDITGKYTLLGLAYSKEAEADLATWFQPVYETFIHKDKGGVFETESYDINLYLIPMFTGINQAAHGKAVKEMKSKVDQTLWPYLLVYKGDIKTYKDQLSMQKKEIPYFFLLDKKGTIIYLTSGAYTDAKMEEIEKHLQEHK